jgi:hypothetical protein
MLSFHHTEHPGMQVKGSGEIKMISLNQTVFNLTRKINKKTNAGYGRSAGINLTRAKNTNT